MAPIKDLMGSIWENEASFQVQFSAETKLGLVGRLASVA